MIKLLLTSDLHLGAGDSFGVSNAERIETFKKICSLAREHDLLLIAGDLFDTADPGNETLSCVQREFALLAEMGVDIVYTPGDREIGENGTLYHVVHNAGVSHLFNGAEAMSMFEWRKHGEPLYIYGCPAARGSDIAQTHKRSRDGFHIGLFHADFSFEDEPDNPRMYILQKGDIRSLNLDFYALGHHHYFKLFKFQNRIIGAYAGSPEAADLSETGDRYVLSIAIDGNEIYQIKRLAVNSLTIRDLSIDCGECGSPEDLYWRVKEHASPKTILKLRATGFRRFAISREAIHAAGECCRKLYFQDDTTPSPGALIDEHRNEDTLRGEFYKLLELKIAGGEIPAGIEIEELAKILGALTRSRRYSPEDWLCE